MTRFVIEGDPIHIAYGSDGITGVFLSVCDKHLKFDPSATDAVNAVTENMGGGGGSYLDPHTGISGFGTRVDDETMTTYLRRFGVPEVQIAKLPLKQKKIQSAVRCTACASASNLRCSRCMTLERLPDERLAYT